MDHSFTKRFKKTVPKDQFSKSDETLRKTKLIPREPRNIQVRKTKPFLLCQQGIAATRSLDQTLSQLDGNLDLMKEKYVPKQEYEPLPSRKLLVLGTPSSVNEKN